MVLGGKKLGRLITNRGSGKQNDELESPRRQQGKWSTRRSKKKLVEMHDVRIGDKINLTDSPFKDCCEGMYPCKIVRRPGFAERDMIAVAGVAGAKAVAQSSKQHVMIVDRHVVEFTRLNEVSGRVAFISGVDAIQKMRAQNGEGLIALFFKSSPDDPLILKCREYSLVSQQIRDAKGTRLVKKEAINKALHTIQEIMAQESALQLEPTVERISEVTSLYEKAAQQFVLAGDKRYKEVEEHKRKFLEQPHVVSLLEGSPQKPKAEPRREPEILESYDTENDDASENWADFSNMDDQEGEHKQSLNTGVVDDIFEYRQDFDAFNLGNEHELDQELDRDGATNDGENSFVFAEFDAMLEAAERELDEIRKM